MDARRENGLLLAATLAVGVIITLFFEWHTDEPLVVLPVLMFVSFAAGWIVPTRFIAIGLCLGLAIPVAHALSSATGLMIPQYQKQAPSTADWVTMAFLMIPAIASAFAGSRIALVAHRHA